MALLNGFIKIVDELEAGELTEKEKIILTTAIWAGTNTKEAMVFEHLTRVPKIILQTDNIKPKKAKSEEEELDYLIKKINKFDN